MNSFRTSKIAHIRGVVTAIAAGQLGYVGCFAQAPSGFETTPNNHADTLFLAASTALSERLKVSLVIEGSPSNSDFDSMARQIEWKIDASDQNVTTMLDSFCEFFGLDWSRRTNVIVLQRDYEKRHYAPETTIPECVQVASDVARLLAPYKSVLNMANIPADPAVKSLIYSITPTQMSRMRIEAPDTPEMSGNKPVMRPINNGFKSDKETLALSDLLPEQQSTLRSVLMNSYTGRSQASAEHYLHQIKRIVKDGCTFHWRVDKGSWTFGCELEPDANGLSGEFIPLSTPVRTKPVSSEQAEPAGTVRNAGSDEPRPARPVSDREAQGNSAALSSSAESEFLGTAVELLRPKLNTQVSVNDALVEMPVAVVGEPRDSAAVALRALADVYRLRILAPSEQSREIVRFPVPVPDRLSELQDALWIAIPDPFVRALHRKDAPSLSPGGAPARTPTPYQLGIAYQGRLKEIRDIAVGNLLSSLEGKAAASRSGRLAFAELSPVEQRAFAEVWMCDYLASLANVLALHQPSVLENYEALRLGVSIATTPHGKFFEFLFFVPSDQFKTNVVSEMFGVRMDLPENFTGGAVSLQK